MATVKEKVKKIPKKEEVKKVPKKVPRALIYEKRNGKPIYYRNYQKVLNGELPLEAVMGSGYLHSLILKLLFIKLFQALDPQKWEILFGEVGFKYKKGSWYNLDLAIWEREKLKEPTKELITVPPKVVIEVDTKIEVEEFENKFGMEYYVAKTDDLLNSGAEKVIWIFTPSKKVLVATKNQPWIMANWDYTFEVLDGIKVNLQELVGKYLPKEEEK